MGGRSLAGQARTSVFRSERASTLIAAIDSLHRSITVALLQRRVSFLGKALGTLPIRKENPLLGGAPHAPADNSPVVHRFARPLWRSLRIKLGGRSIERECDKAFTAINVRWRSRRKYTHCR
jgi:hypothetical protein